MGLFWSPIVFCVVLLQSRLGGLTLAESAVLVGPLMGIGLFVCLSIWFPCKAFSTDRYRLPQLLLRHVASAAVLVGAWLLLGLLYCEILDDLRGASVWRERYDLALPLLLAVGLFLYFMFSLIYTMVLALDRSRRAEQQALESLLSARSAELSSLRASIHPHFLFNSLTSLSTLTRKSPGLAQEIILKLAGFLRYSLSHGQKEWVRVRDELEHINDYLGIEKMRLGDRLEVAFAVVPEAGDVKLPPFTLLPLIENAVKHGFQQSLGSGTLRVSIEQTPNLLNIEVENPVEPGAHTEQGGGYGLAGLKKRLMNAYGDEAGMSVAREEDSFRVTLRLPRREGDEQELSSGSPEIGGERNEGGEE
jgi:hypothetical protein